MDLFVLRRNGLGSRLQKRPMNSDTALDAPRVNE
jgi:hypothetical protein